MTTGHDDREPFTTVRRARGVLQALTADAAVRAREGEEFFLSLEVRLPEIEFAWVDFRVERVPLGESGEVYRHPNRDAVIETWARLEPEGKRFAISIEIPGLRPDERGALVRLSREYPDIAKEYRTRQQRLDSPEP